jgi:Protein of unknown function, DUF547
MKRTILILTFSLSINFLSAQSIDDFFNKSDAFFKVFAKNDKVDYDPLVKNDVKLEEILKMAATIDLSKENAATAKAFWINAYNLLVIKSVIKAYPVKSPLDIKGFFDKITHNIANKKLTLNDIENKMIRAKYKDARIHFALVCGANGCPPIINKAYNPETLDEQLTKQTKLAVNNPNFIKVNSKSKKVEVSQIFEWYKEDFISKDSKEIDFINKYRDNNIDANFKYGYYNYDWTLNRAK